VKQHYGKKLLLFWQAAAGLVIIGLLATVFAERIPQWWWYPLTHAMLVLALSIFLLRLPPIPTGWVRFVRWWYPALLIPFIFSELQHLVHPINPVDIDAQLMAIDYALLGTHPTVWFEHFTVPWVTEYMQLAYVTFYFLPFILCAPLYRQGQFLAFIHLYRKLHRRGPGELDMVKFFRVTPPSVHGMIVKLEELGLISREAGVAVFRGIPFAEPPVGAST